MLGDNSSYIGIDDFSYTPIPEPITIAGSLVAVGFGIWLKRR
ncbi:MAG: PEP-CTERM sorting domain-containing protein [Calothrix sp. SM1_7_51]|nr:PEP-CTERM sorting domain-containing protein [Calothrix sp. SM1_7_51]